MFYQIVLSLQVKKSAIISSKHGIYQLHNELLNDLRPRILGNGQKNPKTSCIYNLMAIPLPKVKILLVIAKKLLKTIN